jgi:hypothetical protein
MARRPFTPTVTAIIAQMAGLLLVAACLFGILVSDIIRNRPGGTTAEGAISVSPERSQHSSNSARVPGSR